MAKKRKLTDLLSSAKNGYNWKYCSLGGVTCVNIASGEDIAHLGELDRKMWTVLSCPVSGLEMDERTLHLIDSDKDGKIRVDEVIEAAQWLCSVLKDPEVLLRGEECVSLDEFNMDTEEGRRLHDSAEQLIRMLGTGKDSVSKSELDELFEHYSADCDQEKTDTLAALAVKDAPYGADSDAAAEAVMAVRDKVADYYMRCKFINFHSDCEAALDVSAESVAAISTQNLATASDEIAKYPLSRPLASGVLPVNEGINPAWQAAWDKARTLTIAVDYPGKESITEAEWQAIIDKLSAYTAAKEALVKEATARLDDKVAAEHDVLRPVEKLLRLKRDYYRLLRNFVMTGDFYDRNKVAIFQAGKLFIDSRCCSLCLRVTDMAAHADMARLSGMFLIYCTCTSKVKNETMDIVAVLTDGDIDNLRVGKNAIFYDRHGQDWDATVTKIIDNPISVRQAFWSPYKKFWNWITEKLNKSAVEKENKSFEKLTAQADAAKLPTTATTAPKKEEEKSNKKQAFDIAKFAGIFAAIGMAVGYITGALTGLFQTFMKTPLSIVLLLVLIMLCVSGPSMFIAWSKLRKRNLGPILNANGWAINAKILVNAHFGSTLTETCDYPKMMFEDPYAEKRMPMWKRWLITVALVLAGCFVLLYFNGYFNRYENAKALHYDESSVIYRAIDKVFGTMKENLEEAAAGLNEVTASIPVNDSVNGEQLMVSGE